MDFTLSPEHQLLRDTTRRIAREVVQPRAAEIDESEQYPDDIFQVFKDHDLLGVAIPREYGGSDLGILGLALAVEEIAKYCNSSALILLLTRLSTTPIILAGSDDLKRRYVTPTAVGELRGSFALSEPGAGSDAAAIQTTAHRRGDRYVLNGVKSWVSGATISDFYTVTVKTDPTAGQRGMSMIVVDSDSAGMSFSQPDKKLGVTGVPTAQVSFEDCEVPASNLIGVENQSFKVLMGGLNSLRPVVAARSLGTAEGILHYAAGYAKSRQSMGKPIIEHQAIQTMLADMAMRVEASRWLTYHSATLVDEGKIGLEVAPHAAMAKAFASETAVFCADNAIQILGAVGYMKASMTERVYRDARQLMIVEGTSQIQRLMIARAIAAGDLIWP